MEIKPLHDIPIKLSELTSSRLASTQPMWSHFSRSAVLNAPLLRESASGPGREQRRRKVWELGSTLHCSIIGTCLSTGELRVILRKFTAVGERASDHDVHHVAVSAVNQPELFAKQIQKALERRHRVVINQFAKARTAEELRRAWDEAMQAGNIPGAYWAALTHPAATQSMAQHVFGAVHMLSHLVGAANRADIRRLSELETENSRLHEKLLQQQERFCEAVSTRDATIRGLNELVARQAVERSDGATMTTETASERAALTSAVGDLGRRLNAEINRRVACETRVERVSEELRREREARESSEKRECALREELAAVETRFAAQNGADEGRSADFSSLVGISLLYVGGRPSQLNHMRALGERLGATFLHHDGGIDDRSGLLAGLVSRADVVLFPVDCVSHDAARMVKRLCRQGAKPYLPLRSSGLASFVAALSRSEIIERRPIAASAV